MVSRKLRQQHPGDLLSGARTSRERSSRACTNNCTSNPSAYRPRDLTSCFARTLVHCDNSGGLDPLVTTWHFSVEVQVRRPELDKEKKNLDCLEFLDLPL